MQATGRALFGVALSALPVFGYFGWWAKDVRLGETTWPLWCLLAFGVAFALRAALRPPAGAKRADRIVAGACAALAVGLAGLFGSYLFGMSWQLPLPAAGGVEAGRALPDVTVADAAGRRLSLAVEQREGSLKGRKLLVAFFRGHW